VETSTRDSNLNSHSQTPLTFDSESTQKSPRLFIFSQATSDQDNGQNAQRIFKQCDSKESPEKTAQKEEARVIKK
jgi:hypothetical protein